MCSLFRCLAKGSSHSTSYIAVASFLPLQHHNGKYLLYYSVSDWNAIDSNVVEDDKGNGWNVQLTQSTSFPDADSTRITIHSERRFALKIRYPKWVANGRMQIRVAGRLRKHRA